MQPILSNNNISLLQDAIDVDMQAGNEEEQIKNGKGTVYY